MSPSDHSYTSNRCLPNSAFCVMVAANYEDLSAKPSPYFADFGGFHHLILQILVVSITLFCRFWRVSSPYFADFGGSHHLILQFLVSFITLFCRFWWFPSPYFADFGGFHHLILQILASFITLFCRFFEWRSVVFTLSRAG
ncbi:MAG: hypothetical protein ACI30L_03205 [Muribaculaceae bacterium]